MSTPTPAQKTLQRVLKISRLNGWSVLIVASISLLITMALVNPLGIIISLLILIAGWMEAHGHRLLMRRSPEGTKWLVRSQIFLLAVILPYCARSIGSFDAGYIEEFVLPTIRQIYQDYLGINIDELMQANQLTNQDLIQRAHQLFVLTYLSVALVSIAYQGGLALYYRRKTKLIIEALTTPLAVPTGYSSPY